MKYKSFYLVVLLLSLGLCLYFFHLVYTEAKQRAIADLNTRQMIHARQARRGIELFVQNALNTIQRLAALKSVIEMDAAGRQELDFTLAIESGEIEALTRVDAAGRILYTTPRNPAVIGKDISGQPHMEKILKTRRPVCSDVFTAVQGYPAIALHVPVYEAGTFRGTLGVLIDFFTISKNFLQVIRVDATGYAWMISRDGTELYCPVPGHTGNSVYENCRAFPSILAMADHMMAGESGTTTYVFDRVRDQKLVTVKKHAVYLPITLVDNFWSIVVASSEDEVLGNLVHFKNRLILIAALLLCAGALFSYYGLKAWGIVREAAARQEAEDALRESEARYRRLAENSPDAIYRMTIPEGRYEYMSPAITTLSGYTPEMFYENPLLIREVIHPEWHDYFEAQWQRLIAGEMPPTYEYRIRHRDGGLRWINQRNLLVTDEAGRPVAIEGIVTDVTERRRIESERERLATAIEQAAETVVITGVDGTIQYVNPAFETITGYSREEAIGQSPQVLKSGRHDPTFYKDMWETITRGETWQGRIINRKKDGTLYTEEATISPVRKPDGAITNFVAVKRDITRELSLEAQFLQAQKMESVGRLAGGVAHDFNNMLGVILGHCEMGMDLLDPSQPLYDDLREIRTAAKRSADLTRQLLAFARKQTITPKVLDIDETVAGMRKMLHRIIGETIDLQWQPGGRVWPVYMDPSQIDQILVNLCVNARDAISGSGRITIATATAHLDARACAGRMDFVPGDFVTLAISDTGCGMDPETQAKIFEPFFTTKEIGQGTGLGLATVYGIVRQNNGFIDVRSAPQSGTTITIYLPRHAAPLQPESDTTAALQKGRGETVLVVEDERMILKLTQRLLTDLGYTVLTAHRPEEALRLAGEHGEALRLLITDVVMPDMSGRELARRARTRSPHLKCLYMSGYPADVIAQHGVLEEGIHFIQKPFSKPDLAARVREAMGSH